MRSLLMVWLLITAFMGTLSVVGYVLDPPVHGHLDPNFCTDCPQFKMWLEDQ